MVQSAFLHVGGKRESQSSNDNQQPASMWDHIIYSRGLRFLPTDELNIVSTEYLGNKLNLMGK